MPSWRRGVRSAHYFATNRDDICEFMDICLTRRFFRRLSSLFMPRFFSILSSFRFHYPRPSVWSYFGVGSASWNSVQLP